MARLVVLYFVNLPSMHFFVFHTYEELAYLREIAL